MGGATRNSNLVRGGASRPRQKPKAFPNSAATHLLLVGPFLAGPRALAALLLDSHHETPMLSRSLAARWPGATPGSPLLGSGGPEFWKQGSRGVRVWRSGQKR